ncbi:alcohol dehydrogenase catalytic domain-containing protein [Rhodococcus sp. 14C212]|uniref:alcohol dehydrogenase catalytic domain-containing protein n=1 Tax=Rhodococcus sp. 14C212 TaxID=2711209 RepID=UPI0013EC44A4|nr:alcohol dehydrogenase catalytic domain-containing protein [Rhodococcus sp. 14C212]NGP05135.1 alcohol dehydrogenase catalytic domain-containing protein [Rhodococcus sp. 14C212]
MRAWLFDGPKKPLRRADVDVPVPAPGNVLIKVRGAGLCHSDVGFLDGTLHVPVQSQLSIVLGHEAAGEIAAVGDGVAEWHVGDKVVAAGSLDDCPGGTRDGAYADYFTATASRLVRLPEGTDWGQAAASTDAGVTSYFAVVARGGVRAGDRVGIVGLGGLGLTGARIAVLRGATVFAAEPREETWELARAAGVDRIVTDVSEYEGLNLDVVVDFAGFGTTTNGAVKAVKPGGVVVQVGLGLSEFPIQTWDWVMRNVTLVGSTPDGDPEHLRAVIEMVASGNLSFPLEAIDFEDIPEGLRRLARGEVTGRLYAALPE